MVKELDTIEESEARALRILTIDNCGLQGVSILRILSQICSALSKVDGHESRKAPHELFDIIAGVGTGGWLAILLGRYKFDIDQCFRFYISTIEAVSPSLQSHKRGPFSSKPTALSQERFMDKIDILIAHHNVSAFMLDKNPSISSNTGARECYAFAVGVVKGIKESGPQDYHLFRAYHPPSGGHLPSPIPYGCEVSNAYAATAASKDLLQPCRMSGVTYWDERFSLTHNVSSLALDEKVAIFGAERPVSVVVNISPCLPTKGEVDQPLQGTAEQASKFHKATNSLKKMLKPLAPDTVTPADIHVVGSEAKQIHEVTLRERVKREYGRDDIYQRLYSCSEGDKPYLDDADNTPNSIKIMEDFLARDEAQATIAEIVARCIESTETPLAP